MSDYRISNISKRFGELQVLRPISADFPESSVTAVLGPSGAGKTTLLNIISGLISADSGSIGDFSGATFSYSFQEPRLLPWMSVLDNILFALSSLKDKQNARDRAIGLLAEAGLGDFADALPSHLSGGMRQKASLARAFAFPSDVLLLDEAFSAVDLKVRIGLLDLFATLWEDEKRTTVFVTHDLHDALYIADSIILLSARPARIVDSISIAAPRAERRYDGRGLEEVERRLYRQILEET